MTTPIKELELTLAKSTVDFGALRNDRRSASQSEKEAADNVARLKTINIIAGAMLADLMAESVKREKTSP